MIPFDEFLAGELADPEFAALWEAQAVARAIATAVVSWRTEHTVTQSGLARLMGVSQPVVARMETGEHEPTGPTLRKLSLATGLTFSVTTEQGRSRVCVTRAVDAPAAVA